MLGSSMVSRTTLSICALTFTTPTLTGCFDPDPSAQSESAGTTTSVTGAGPADASGTPDPTGGDPSTTTGVEDDGSGAPCPSDADGDGVCDDEDVCPEGDDTLDGDADGLPDACDPCPQDNPNDGDMDGVCDSEDACPSGNDALDADMDGVPDACDACPQDATDDSDMDGVCDSEDVCPGGDDQIDEDMNGVPDACESCVGDGDGDGDGVCDADDICPGGDDTVDLDMDGIPDLCSLEVLVVNGFGAGDLEGFLSGWGFNTTLVDGGTLVAGYDYTPYDVVAVMYNSTVASVAHLDGEVAAGTVGLVIHRGDDLVDDFGLGTEAYWQDGDFEIDDNSHFISAPFAVGPVPLDYTYKSSVTAVPADATALGSATGASLVVHDVHRKVVTPYYGHTAGMPWNDAGAMLTWRSYIWASGVGG